MTSAFLNPPNQNLLRARRIRLQINGFLCCVVGTALGITVGVVTASILWPATIYGLAQDSQPVAAALVKSVVNPLSPAGQPQLPEPVVAGKSLETFALPVVAPPTVQRAVFSVKRSSALHARSRKHVSASRRRLSARHNAFLALIPFVPGKVHIVSDLPVVSRAAGPETDATAHSFTIEGDDKVVDFDLSAGTVTTDGGETFVLAKAILEKNLSVWENSPVHVHYRCDVASSCTISFAGTVLSNIRMERQSDRASTSGFASNETLRAPPEPAMLLAELQLNRVNQ